MVTVKVMEMETVMETAMVTAAALAAKNLSRSSHSRMRTTAMAATNSGNSLNNYAFPAISPANTHTVTKPATASRRRKPVSLRKAAKKASSR